MSVSVTQTLLLCASAWLLWRGLLRRFYVKSVIDNLPGPPVESVFAGHLQQFMAKDGWDFQVDLATQYGPVVGMKGLLCSPGLYVSDPKALHHIIVKDQYSYEESPVFIQLSRLAFGPSLFGTVGDYHKKQRKMLNPVFSMAHMRDLLPIFGNVVSQFRDLLVARVADGTRELDMMEWMGRTSLELMGQGGLGHSFNALQEDTHDEYSAALKDLQPAVQSFGLWALFVPLMVRLVPPGVRRRLANVLPSRRVEKFNKLADTMYQQSVDIFRRRKVAVQKGDEAIAIQEVGKGKDILSILIRENLETKSEADRLPEEELIAQISALCFAGTDTTSNALARILYLLSERQDIQHKLRAEVIAVRSNGQLSYDQLMQLPFLDAIIRETMRLHPPATSLSRIAMKDMVLPLSQPVRLKNGHAVAELPIPAGTEIWLGITGWNLNKSVWGDDVMEWKPERWLSPLPSSVTDAHIPGVYSNLMSFLGGGRACIGFKFAELEMKVALSTLLQSFTFELTEKPIAWNMAAVRYPAVGKDSIRPEMPLKVGLYKPPTPM